MIPYFGEVNLTQIESEDVQYISDENRNGTGATTHWDPIELTGSHLVDGSRFRAMKVVTRGGNSRQDGLICNTGGTLSNGTTYTISYSIYFGTAGRGVTVGFRQVTGGGANYAVTHTESAVGWYSYSRAITVTDTNTTRNFQAIESSSGYSQWTFYIGNLALAPGSNVMVTAGTRALAGVPSGPLGTSAFYGKYK